MYGRSLTGKISLAFASPVSRLATAETTEHKCAIEPEAKKHRESTTHSHAPSAAGRAQIACVLSASSYIGL